MTADDNGTQDQAADYNREGQERAANNNSIRHKTMKPTRQQSCEKRKKSSLCKNTFFSNAVYLVEFSAPAKTSNVTF
jgi:hypothetical protein